MEKLNIVECPTLFLYRKGVPIRYEGTSQTADEMAKWVESIEMQKSMKRQKTTALGTIHKLH